MNVRLGLAFTLALVLAACGESPTAAGDSALVVTRNNIASVVPGTCTNLTQLNALSATIFTPGSSPNINSVRGKLGNLDKLVKKGKVAEAQAAAGEIVAFTLKKHNQGGLGGTDAQVKAFTNAVLCFAGIDIDVELPDNTFLIMPSDQPQVVTNVEGTAGINFAANPVSEPTLVVFSLIPDVYPQPGAGPLDTKLDQYPGFIQITKESETDAPLAKPAVVAVCAVGVIPADVRARLRLGHGASAGFEITPSASGAFISCPNQTAQSPATSGWARVGELLMPAKVQAFQQEFGGGVGGTVTEFSPFAPVDPQLEFGGGVGGTVTEFSRMPGASAPVLGAPKSAGKNASGLTLTRAATASIVLDPCAYGQPGAPLSSACVPSIRVTTLLGTELTNVPVTWDVLAGGGSIAPKTAACGSFGSTASTLTNASGRAGICWTLGALGSNKVRATPSAGGDAPDGVIFTPSQAEFEVMAVAGPAAAITKVLGDGQSAPAGSTLPIAPKVRVTDAYGFPVSGVRVYWVAIGGIGSVTPADPSYVLTDANGYASASWQVVAGGNQLRAAIYDPDHFWVMFGATGTTP